MQPAWEKKRKYEKKQKIEKLGGEEPFGFNDTPRAVGGDI